MKLFNTLSNTVEEFKSLEDKKVRMYTCGPTVYDSAHIGNLRAYTFGDLLKRVLKFNDFSVLHAMNITDVDDKTIKKGEGKRLKYEEVIKKYEEKFWADEALLNIEKPDIVTRATEYIDKIVSFIEELLAKNFAYKADDGSVYFSIAKFQDYGKLSHLNLNDLKAGARVAQDEYDKENPADFVLWKAWDEVDGEIFWQTSLGKGRPGWHIECSAMSTDVLGDTIDIHTGGVDLIFPHHENEIAQSEARTGKKFVNYWLHNEHILVDGRKMSKSLNNFYTLDDVVAKGFSPLDFRYFVLGAHYRSKLNFTWEGLEAAKNARERLVRILSATKDSGEGKIIEKYLTRFNEKISDDLNTPEALAVVWELMRDENEIQADKNSTIKKMDEALGLGLMRFESEKIPNEVKEFAEERKIARNNKDFTKSDILRDEILSMGFIIEDKSDNEYSLGRK